MKLLQSVLGILDVEVISADFWTVIRQVNASGIAVYAIREMDEMTFQFYIGRKNLQFVQESFEKRGDRFRIMKRRGIYWTARAAIHRPMLLSAVAMLAAMSLSLPTRVLFIQVDGNNRIPANRILQAAEASGIHFFANRRDVRSEQVKNRLISQIPELQWAAVNTVGCTAMISVQERSEPVPFEAPGTVCSIIAAADGIVESCTAAKGNLLCHPGQAIKQGQILISGYTDCGLVIQAVRAEGEIEALTEHSLQAVIPSGSREIRGITRRIKKYSLLLGKNRINLWNSSGIWEDGCGRIYEEKYLILPGKFRLPIALCCETIDHYAVREAPLAKEEGETLLCLGARQYLLNHLSAGTVLSEQTAVSVSNGVYQLLGKYSCREMIGRIHWEQIGDHHGEISRENRER